MGGAPLNVLEWSDGIALAARDHCATGREYLYGPDGSMTWGRITRYGKAPDTVGENLAFGLTSAEDILMQMFIDFGAVSRGQRDMVMSSRITHTGIATCTHSSPGGLTDKILMTDIAYAQDFELNQAGAEAVVQTLEDEKILGGRALSASTQEETLDLNKFMSEAMAVATKVAAPTLITALVLIAM
jgi:hypothetical protein